MKEELKPGTITMDKTYQALKDCIDLLDANNCICEKLLYLNEHMIKMAIQTGWIIRAEGNLFADYATGAVRIYDVTNNKIAQEGDYFDNICMKCTGSNYEFCNGHSEYEECL